jgi:hypothetical protein
MQTKKQLIQAIRKQTKPQKGFAQWLLVIEHRRLSENMGLILIEAQLDGKIEWSGSASANLPEAKKIGLDGQPAPSEWDQLKPGQSRFNAFTFEMRGKSVIEMMKGVVKRSLEEGKLQDLLPWGKG